MLSLAHALQPTALRLVDEPPQEQQDEEEDAPSAWTAPPADDAPLAVPAADEEPSVEADAPVVQTAPAAEMPTTVRASGGGMIPWWVALITGLGGFVVGMFTCYACLLLIATSYFY